MSAHPRRRLTIFIAHPSELLTDHLPHGDGLVAFGFIKRLAERGHELHVAAQCVDVRSAPPPTLHVYELVPGSRLALSDRLRFMARMRALFRRLSRRVSFDLIHQMNPVFTGVSLALYGARVPLVLGTFIPNWECDADVSDTGNGLGAKVLRSFQGVVARLQQSQAAGLLIATPEATSRIAAPDRHNGHIYQVSHGIDITRFAERTAVPNRKSVLFLTSVIYRKGIFTLLDAFEQVARAIPDAELVIAGKGLQLEEVRARAAQMTGCSIRLLGHVDRQDVPALMRQHSVYCLPSYGEPFATTILEAMACGVPVVATASAGLRHQVTEAGGRLVRPRDASGLAAALIEILSSPGLQESMGRHNRARVEAEFEIEKAVDRLERAYASVLRSSPSTPADDRAANRVHVDVVRPRLSGKADQDAMT